MLAKLTVAIVGAGIVGAALADRLSRAGALVTLIDAHEPGRGTSASSLGWLNANRQPRPYFDLRVAALHTWASVATELGGPPWYRPVGNLAWATQDDAQAELGERVRRLRDWGYAADIVTPDMAGRLEPELRLPAGALVGHFPNEGYVEGGPAVDDLVARARAHGATVVSNAEVVGLDIGRRGVVGVRLASPHPAVQADVVACCAGWRSRELLRLAGADLRLIDTNAPGSRAHCAVATTTPATARPTGVLHGPHIEMRPAGEAVLIEAGDIDAQIDARTSRERIERFGSTLLDRAVELIPGLRGASVRSVRRCVRPLPEDGLPIVGWHPSVPGMYLAVTHSGITLAPHLSELIAADLAGGEIDALGPYRPTRFARRP
jgi:glycine/D-amino acid oxidase-like deaminating enzyme